MGRRSASNYSSWYRYPFGEAMSRNQRQNLTAFVYNKHGDLLAVGRNSYTKTHPLMYKAGAACGKPGAIYMHAELDALVKVKDWDKAYKMVVVRYTKDGKPAMAAPCKICQSIIKQTGIKIVEHT